MSRIVRTGGFLTLVVPALGLLGTSILTPESLSFGAAGISLAVALVGTVAIAAERKHAFGLESTVGLERSDTIDAVAVAVGAVLTFGLSVDAGLGPVLASALVGVGAGVAVPRLGAAIYCGSFVGMATPAVFGSYEYLLIAGVLAGVAFVAAKGSFDGFGGKLGTIALFGCVTTVLLTSAEFGAGTPPQWELLPVVVPVAALGAVATIALSERFDYGAVIGSGAVGVVAGVGFPLLVPSIGATLAAVAFCASFVGMSTTDRLETELRVALVGALSGVVFLAVAPAFDGSGGKLGAIAFVSCIAYAGFGTVLESVRIPNTAAGSDPFDQ